MDNWLLIVVAGIFLICISDANPGVLFKDRVNMDS